LATLAFGATAASVRARVTRSSWALIGFAERRLAPILLLAIRLWMANIFFRSGLLKIHDLDGAIFLFAQVHPVPFLPPELAAYLATTIELVCSTLLALGLAARLAALPMLAMALVIQFVVGAHDPAFYQIEHYYWVFLLAAIITKGPGSLSLDHLLERRLGQLQRETSNGAAAQCRRGGLFGPAE
jgi:putative oxidoreductase